MQTYKIVGGDTFTTIANKFKTSVTEIQYLNPGVNPNDLQIGQIIQVPGTVEGTTRYKIQGGDTFGAIASRLGTDIATIQSLNPGVNPNTLQIGQIINVPPAGSVIPVVTRPNPTPPGPTNPGNGLVSYSGPASSFPNPDLWAPYSKLWAHNSNLMQFNNSSTEISLVGHAIQQIAQETGMDARCILCMIMQESGGNVKAGITFSWEGIRNTGLMQAHNGVIYDPANPAGSITQMIRDGSAGTRNGDGLKQCFARFENYYEAFRAYNSGSVDRANLSNGLGATNDYVSKMANRLLGHVWANM